ncbi:DNA-directed RNA polymerase subunit omega [Portibacter marinus]|uniref:DNA-directed RNA polymerase subunit omega n=1 Tax=Portibacter marinus TaxID=2898660 RepID=UPI001F26E48C|nr:DNA-directed RNA polymerase subunit omega [Portibacter marinus]
MNDLKTQVQGIDPNLQGKDMEKFVSKTQNVYETLEIISKRANQLAGDLKEELHQKLEEFAVTTDAIEEVHENKEQIEISKFYERLPNPAVIATYEYLNGELKAEYKQRERNNNE